MSSLLLTIQALTRGSGELSNYSLEDLFLCAKNIGKLTEFDLMCILKQVSCFTRSDNIFINAYPQTLESLITDYETIDAI
ncbi:hypothetical protein [Desulfitispora alkaliphila]|uniref:hypothetical protein n=1 Tax=Desulfitispora alkaliphila TaxID=622674 RepID=UPI003D22AA48